MLGTLTEGWLDGIEHRPSPYFNPRPDTQAISLLVIHNISLPPNRYGGPYITDLFTGKLDPDLHPFFKGIAQLQVSSHFLIRRNGQIIQFVACDKRAWHAGLSCYQGRDNCNDFSIGIELEGSDVDNFTPVQYEQLSKLTNVLYCHYPLQDIVGHSDIAPGRKSDPGPCFNWNDYRQRLALTEKVLKKKSEPCCY